MKLKEVLYFTVAFGFFAWCVVVFRNDIAQIKIAPIYAAWDAVLLAAVLSLLNYLLRIIRWTVYLSRLGHTLKFNYSALTYIAGFAFTLSPGKVGEMVRGRYLQNSGVSMSNTAAAFFVERLMDLLAMIALASLAAASSTYQGLIWGAVTVIVVIMLMLTLAPWQRIALYTNTLHRIPAPIQKVLQTVVRTLLSAKQLLQPGILSFGFAIGLLAWGCEGLGLMVIGHITPAVSMDMPTAIGIYSIAVIVGALSFLPGGLGGTEAVMIALLTAHGYPLPDALLLTLICRLLTLWLAVAIGWLAVFALRPKPNREIYFSMTQTTAQTPLCVDLDGTLIHSDLLLESLLLLLKRNPLYVFLLPLWLSKGKAALKAQIAQRVVLNAAALPYNQAFLAWLETEHQSGRELWLCTASNHRLADLVATHIPIFTGVLASSDELNLSGQRKAAQLVEKFGEKGFDYCGNAHIDLKVWQHSQAAIAVNCKESLSQEAGKLTELRAVFPKTNGFFKPAIKALRPHQWAKNVLIFIPLAAAHKLTNNGAIEQALLAFLAFGLCASSVYLLNDMLDLEVDRQHPRKCKRPFASGNLSLIAGFFLVPLLLIAALLIASQLPVRFCEVLGAYYTLTLAYSFGLKRIVLIDTITLAGLYTARIIAGATAIAVPLSFWLLLFSVFLFFSLALVKRYAELDAMQRQGKLKAAGRGYHIEDLPILHSLGTASGNLCVLVLALYINSPEVQSLYHHPQAIWMLCVLLLYWISRVWLKAHRGKMHDDPVVFAMKDRISLAVGALAAIAVTLAV
ncbi:UbiA family prenyltransferase [Methylomonas sp. AM2-LC]|uniref:UbiA family prenyltransferase n=1 Tax=Methylomonas sp. AM2-LC TaxID=3153301 RepID=UPI003267B35C